MRASTGAVGRSGRRRAAGGWIVLRAGASSFAIEASSILRVVKAEEIVALPATKPEVAGVLLIDREAVPVYRASRLLELAGTTAVVPEERTLGSGDVVVVEQDGVRAGLLVDGADRAAEPPDPGTRALDVRRLLETAGIVAARAADGTAARAADGEI